MAALGLLSNACQTPRVVTAAQQGDLPSLARAIDQQRQSTGFTLASLKQLARAVAEREIAAASDEATHGNFEAPPVDGLRICADGLRTALTKRATRGDDTAFAAELSRVQSGASLSTAEFLARSKSPHGWARATAAEASTDASRWDYRHEALLDPDARVRHAALRSVQTAPAERDRESLVALLRAAPDPKSREDAARAIGLLGGDNSYRALVDAWPNAKTPLRLAIVNAFAQLATYQASGAERLRDIARSEPGIVGIAAAKSLVEGQGKYKESGHARISRALDSGSTDEQRLAISAADWSRPEQAERLVRLGLKKDDAVVQVSALERWLERGDHAWPATTMLRQISESISPEGILARSILSQKRDWSVATQLRQQLRYANAETRSDAARDLLRLGDYNSVARALADDAPSVRLRTACLVLSER